MNQNLILYGKRVCFIGAHPDDIELGCGALISNISQQTDVLCVTLSDNKKNPDLQNLIAEHKASMAVLGVTGERDVVKDFETDRKSVV